MAGFLLTRKIISIHAAREGGDIARAQDSRRASVFQSTPPVKAATVAALRFGLFRRYFNPRRP